MTAHICIIDKRNGQTVVTCSCGEKIHTFTGPCSPTELFTVCDDHVLAQKK